MVTCGLAFMRVHIKIEGGSRFRADSFLLVRISFWLTGFHL